MELFGLDLEKNEEPKDDTVITTTLLYLSEDELKEFKKLCRKGIKEMYGKEYHQKGNLPDFLLTILREKYGENI